MSLDIYELVLEVEEEFGVTIPDAEAQTVQSVGDLYNVTLKVVRMQHPERSGESSVCENEVWEQLKALLVYQLGLEPAQVVPSARFFFELGFD